MNVCALNDPQGCDVVCGDGVPFTWTVPSGTVLGQGATHDLAKANANYLAANLACERARTGKICFATQNLPDGQTFLQYNQTIRAMGGVPWRFPFLPTGCGGLGIQTIPYDFRVIGGTLPPGLTLGCFEGGNPGQIMGMPTVDGLYNFIVQVTDSVGAYQRKQFSIRIGSGLYPDITPPVGGGPAYWNGGLPVPAGTYRIVYVNGALRYGNNDLWFLNITVFTPLGPTNVVKAGFWDFQPDWPFTPLAQAFLPNVEKANIAYGSQALVEAANTGEGVMVLAGGGRLGMFLQDSDYSDNHAGEPSPTFRLLL